MTMGLFSEYSTHTRASIFYGICIPLRVIIAYLIIVSALAWYDATMISLIVLASLMFVTESYLHYHPRGWWYHGLHACTSALMIIVAANALNDKNEYYPFVVGGIVITDLAIGLITSINVFYIKAS